MTFLWRRAGRDESGELVESIGAVRDVTARWLSQQALESEYQKVQSLKDQFQQAVDTIPGLVWSALPDGHIDFLNQRWREYTGLTLEQASGWGWRAAIHPDDLPGLESYWRSVLAAGNPGEAEARLRRADGEYRWSLFRAVPVRDERGKIGRWYGTNTDIHDRKLTEQALRALEKHARSLVTVRAEVGAELSKSAPAREVLRGCAEALVRCLDAAFVRIWTLQREADMLELQASAGLYTRLDGSFSRIEVGTLKVGRIAQERKPHLTNDVLNDPQVRDKDWARSCGLVGFAGYPLIVDERVVGVMAMFARHPLPQTTLDTLASVADAIAQGLERKRADEAMLAARARFEGILEIADDAIISVDTNQRIMLFNQGAEKIFGYTQTEVMGRPLELLLPQRLEEIHRRHIEQFARSADVARTMGQRREVSGRRKDGREFPAEASISKLNLGGELVFSVILRDITERKRTEQRLVTQHTITQILAEAASLEEATPKILQALCECLVWDLGELWRTDRAAGVLRCVEVWHKESVKAPQFVAASRDRTFMSGTGLPGRVWASRAPAYIPDVVQDANFPRASIAAREGLHASFAFPILLGSEVVGVMDFFSQEIRQPDQDLLDMMATIGSQIGQFIERKRAEADLQNSIDEIKKLKDQLHKENIALREEIDKASMFENIVGESPALRAVLERVAKVAPTDSTVLITGETGTGKELIARAIHKWSQRSSRAFVSVNCSAVPTTLIASELFGHEKGAFTGALQRRLGRFELAEGGTIFLDEIGELPAETQIALLRVLQEREFERVGGGQPIRADVRVIAASNRDLESAISAGAFRKDLFYRLNVFPIEIPPLRKRREDIPTLIEYFIHRYSRKAGKKIRTIRKKTLELLESYAWPGNIRELQNVIERSVIVCDTDIFSVDSRWLSFESSSSLQEGLPNPKKSAAQQREAIEKALAATGGRVSGPSGAAAQLNMPASTLESKIRSLKINKYRFKNA